MDKDKVRQVAKSIMFDIDDDVLVTLVSFFDEHLEDIANLKSIDTDSVTPMTRVDDTLINFMRDDVPCEALSKDKLLANVASTHMGYVCVPKREAGDD